MAISVWAMWYNRNKYYHERKKGRDITATMRIVIRNHEGLLMVACTYPLGRTGDPTTAEAKACLQVVIFGKKWVFKI
ncbi:hypothetical protein GOBAR_DD19974 [Gossypium barbadense]|nr:hypothetical protein GOBAR_DD19974 [Gossypium barbadense]